MTCHRLPEPRFLSFDTSFGTELSNMSYVSDLLLTHLIVQFTVLTTHFNKNSNKITCLDRMLSI